MCAGTLRHPIIVETSVEAQTDTGEITTTWQPYQTLMAAIETTGGREFEAVKQTHSELTHIIKTRYWSGITSKMRINHAGRILEIIAPPINEREKNVSLKILCKEID